MARLLGLDIGTTNVKALLFESETAVVLGVAGREYPIYKPLPDRAEQNPDDWWQATVQAVWEVIAQAGSPEVHAIGLSGQMHGGVLLDQNHQPLLPAIIWADQRSTAHAQRILELLGKESYLSTTGTLPASGFMIATLLWLAEHQPDVLAKIQAFLLPKDYVRLRLTGEIATDISDAAATGIFEVVGQQWSEAMLLKLGLPTHFLPPVLASSAIAGQLTPPAAAELGLEVGIPVIAGCADQPAQAIGNGIIRVGKASLTTGSGGQVFVPLPLPSNGLSTHPALHVFNHAVPQMVYILGATLAAGLNLRWFRNLVGLENLPDAYPLLSAEAAQVPPGAEGLLFLPYLLGERLPQGNQRGSFLGLSYYHGRGHLARAIMEGVTFSLRQALELSFALGGKAEVLITGGGAAESPVWRQMQADIVGLPLQKNVFQEQACLGAALLAGVGIGHYATFEEATHFVRYGDLTEPDPQRHSTYNTLYQQFLEWYARMSGKSIAGQTP